MKDTANCVLKNLIFSLGHPSRNYIFQPCLQSDVAMWPMSCHGTWMQIPFFCCRWNCLPWIFLVSLTFPFSQAECFQHLNRVQEHLWKKKCSKYGALRRTEPRSLNDFLEQVILDTEHSDFMLCLNARMSLDILLFTDFSRWKKDRKEDSFLFSHLLWSLPSYFIIIWWKGFI